MTDLFVFLILVSLFGMLLGLIKPSLVLYWGEKRTRLRALGWYGLFAVFAFIAMGVTMDGQTKTTPGAEQAASTPAQPAPAALDPAQEEARKQVEAAQAAELARQKTEQTKATVRHIMAELLAADRPGSDAAGFARSMAQAAGKRASLGDIYGAFKAAKLVADDSFTKLMKYALPQGLPEDVHDKMNTAHAAFRRAAMLRGDIAEAFMEWLDTRKPSLENTMREKSDQVTLAMTMAVVSLTEAMTAAGFNGDEVKAELAAMSGKEQAEQAQADAGKPAKKKKSK